MKRAWNYVIDMWQPASLFIVGSLIVVALFSFRIGGLVPASAPAEVASRSDSQTISKILDNPINAPYKVAQYGIQHLHKSVSFQRLLSGLIAGFSVILFYIIARRFYSTYASIGASILYATSSSLLHNGRLAVPEISMLFLFMLIACGYYLRFHKRSKRTWLTASFVLGLSLYTPGLLYFIVAAIAWQYRTLIKDKNRPSWGVVAACGVITLLTLSPLILGFVHNNELWRPYFGLPPVFPSLFELLRRLLAVPAGMFIYAPANQLYRLGHLPTLDIFASCMFVLGCYQLVIRHRLDRLKVLGGIFAITTLFSALSGNYENSFVLLPFVYLIVGMGINFLQQSWNKVFPFNPLARWLAVIVLSLCLVVSCNFQMRRYFVAWPHNSVTERLFSSR